jgi:hypothetical protein
MHCCSLLFERSVHPNRGHPGNRKGALMKRTLSLDEQREFWAELFTLAVRYETRKRPALEVTLELLEDVRETETNQI